MKPVCGALSFLFFTMFISPAFSATLVINEIMFNPNGNENAREYVEIMNRSDQPVSLEGCFIGQGDSFDKIIPVQGSAWTVPSGGYALIMDPDYFSAGEPYAGIPASTPFFTVPDKTIGSGGLSNTNPKPVYLLSAKGDTLTAVRYPPDCPPGHSWERVNPGGGDSADNFRSSRDVDGTPGRVNSVTPPSHNPALTRDSIRFGAALPKMGESCDLYISYLNGGLSSISGIRVAVQIAPDTPLESVTFPGEVAPGEKSSEQILHISALPGGFLQIQAAIDSPDSMNWASDDTVRVELEVLVPAGTIILNEIMAAPVDGPEWVEIQNTGTSPVSLWGWRITDRTGRPSEGIGQGAFIPSSGYAVITGDPSRPAVPSVALFIPVKKFPSLNNDGDTVILLDHTGGIADSVSYSAAPAGVSLELIAPSLRGTPLGWNISVDPAGSTPGRRNSIFFDQGSGAGGSTETGAVLLIEPNPFLEKATITYRLPFPLARVRMIVYDRRGREIAIIRDAAESGFTWTGTWDGRSGGKKLPAGPYILYLEALNKTTGKMTVIRKTIVVASRL
ncbi:MAG: lamin tail domain-containing protein [Candidatus Latescibacter sp.]|nr:lamin tail domain-containing protein [Candidatus Latescibacter sp.]